MPTRTLRASLPDTQTRSAELRPIAQRLETPPGQLVRLLPTLWTMEKRKDPPWYSGSWFFLDIAYYGLGLNNSIILGAIGYTGGGNVYQTFYRTALGNLILVCAGALPGYWASVATIDTLGRKPIQFCGFAMLTALFVVIGFAYNVLPTNALFALYVVAQFFFNFGPNVTTFIVPGECFPTRYRSTSHGISAATGKLGAVISQVVFGPLRTIGAVKGATTYQAQNPWINHIMQIFALFMLMGLFTSFLIPETKRKTLEELAGEVPGTPNYDPISAGHAHKQVDNTYSPSMKSMSVERRV